MRPMKTPGVYIVEKNAFPNSAVQVATAVPAFIGYTETAMNGNEPIPMKPWRISSMAEFHRFFGGAPDLVFEFKQRGDDEEPPTSLPALVDEEQDAKDDLPTGKIIVPPSRVNNTRRTFDMKLTAESRYGLYAAMRHFFANGGSACYVVSIGDYKDDIEKQPMLDALQLLIAEPEPTMVVIPETTRLTGADCIEVQQQMLMHCGTTMKNRFAILDIFGGYADTRSGDPVALIRNKLGTTNLDYGAAYYPWVNTSIYSARDFGFASIDKDSRDALVELLKEAANPENLKDDKLKPLQPVLDEIDRIEGDDTLYDAEDDDGDTEEAKAQARDMLDKTVRAVAPIYTEIANQMARIANCIPPAAAMAGIYTAVDNARGVWKAPANVSMAATVSPTVNITHFDQETLNVTPQGKSINAIRPFVGEGVLVWGARTLDGNSLDWRYINVRRTMIMLEESIKLAAKAYVFEPNTANTWVTIRSMIENFLTTIWKQGGLAGAVPEDAFSVHVGLGDTMTSVDILEGIMRITVLVAVSRPAEFIEITFQQQMQKS